jgi:hypothetical protein
MSTTLSKGYKLPETGDRGSSFFPDLEDNIELGNSHKHDGSDGERVNIKDLVKQSQTLSNGDWGADTGGSTYTRSVTMPTGVIFDDVILKFKTSGGDVIYPTVTKTGASAYDITVNDNSITVLVTYV